MVVHEVADGLHPRPADRTRQDHAAAPVSKTVTIALHGDRGLRHQMIRTLEIGEPREVYVERCNHRHRLGKVEAEFAPDMDSPISRLGAPVARVARGCDEAWSDA